MEKPLVLVADDDKEIVGLIKFKLERSGYQVDVVDNGAKALEAARRLRPDLVVLDVMMPVMDGFEVLHELKQSPDTAGIPAMMLTAREMEEDVLKSFRLGAVDYMIKPFSPAELLARVRSVLEARGK